MMRVIHVVTSLKFGGVEKHLVTISEYGKKTNYKHIFVAIGTGGESERQIRNNGYDVFILNKKVKIPSLEAIISLFKLFRRINPIVVHTHGAEANFHGLIAANIAGVPVRLGEEIGIPSHSMLAKWIFKCVYAVSSGVIGVSEQVVDWLVENGEVSRNKTYCTYLPVKVETHPVYQVEKTDYFSILTVCRLHPVKNLKMLINSVGNLIGKGKNIELIIVGDGPEREKLEDMAQRKGLEDYVAFKGYKSKPWKYATCADLFVMPSFSEGFGLSLVEAMMHKLPVVATNRGGPVEFIEHEKNGWLIDPDNQDALTTLIAGIIELPTERLQQIADKGYETAIKKFSPERYMERLDNLYSDLLSQHK